MNKKDKSGEPYWSWLEKRPSDESDHDSNDETESENKKDNDESNE